MRWCVHGNLVFHPGSDKFAGQFREVSGHRDVIRHRVDPDCRPEPRGDRHLLEILPEGRPSRTQFAFVSGSAAVKATGLGTGFENFAVVDGDVDVGVPVLVPLPRLDVFDPAVTTRHPLPELAPGLHPPLVSLPLGPKSLRVVGQYDVDPPVQAFHAPFDSNEVLLALPSAAVSRMPPRTAPVDDESTIFRLFHLPQGQSPPPILASADVPRKSRRLIVVVTSQFGGGGAAGSGLSGRILFSLPSNRWGGGRRSPRQPPGYRRRARRLRPGGGYRLEGRKKVGVCPAA